jgi:GrpB-like predicted nucleotidyltransferase (UPF0157 family)
MDRLTLVDYDAEWPTMFLRVAQQLHQCIAPVSAAIEHIGSTAVPGLCAKPVLDLLVGVRSLGDIEPRIAQLAGGGFTYRQSYEAVIPDRRYFVRPDGVLPRVHVHVVVQHGSLWRRHLVFRDRLRADPSLSEAYASLKRRSAAEHTADKAAYQDAKAPFILRVLAEHDI